MRDPYAAVQSVIARLRERITDANVDEMVDDPDGYTLAHPACAILVQYSNSVFQGMGPDKSRRIPMIDVYVVARSIRGPQGAIAFLARVQDALSGHAIEGQSCGRLYPLSDRFISVTPSQWQYVATFSLLGIYPHKTESV